MEARAPEFLDKIFGFCRAVGLPTTFDEMTLKDVDEAALEAVALVASRDILIRSFAGARSEKDRQGRFYDHREILNGLKATNAYGCAWAKTG